MSTLERLTEMYNKEASTIGGAMAGIGAGAMDVLLLPTSLRVRATRDSTSIFQEYSPQEIVRRKGDPNWDVRYDMSESSVRPLGRVLAATTGIACALNPELRPVSIFLLSTIGMSALYEGIRYARNVLREKTIVQE